MLTTRLLFMALFFLAVPSLILSTAAFSSARLSNEARRLQRRQCKWSDEHEGYTDCDDKLPTVAELVERIRDVDHFGLGDAEHHAVFYTNLEDGNLAAGGDPWAAWFHGWLEKEKLEFYWTGDAIDEFFLEDQKKWIEINPQLFTRYEAPGAAASFGLCYYQALAAAAVNPDAYLFTKKDEEWKADSVWASIEYPALTQNPNVQRIWRVDPRPPDVKGIKPEEACDYDKKEILWERGKDAVLPLGWECPAT